jgi:hypothetical protein
VKLRCVLKWSYFPAYEHGGYQRSLGTVTPNHELYSEQTVLVMMIIFRFETSQHGKWATTCVTVLTRYFCLQDLTWIQITCKSLFTQQPGFEIIHVLIRSARITYFHSRSLLPIAAGLLSGAFAWWGKTPISFVISVRLSASFSAAYTRGFPWNLMWGCLWKSVERFQIYSKSEKMALYVKT